MSPRPAGRADRPEAILAGLLAGMPSPPPRDWVPAASRHGLVGLIHQRIAGGAAPSPLAHPARRQALRDMVQTEEDRRVLAALHGAGLRPLVLKGAALAHWLYPASWLRPREDTDLLLPDGQHRAAGRVLEQLGYRRRPQVEGGLVMGQVTYQRADHPGGGFVVDLHRRVCNIQSFADRLPYDRLMARARRLPALGAAARGLGEVDALLHACLHRLAHHGGGQRLIWLYDIHLLAARLDGPACSELHRRAQEEGLRAVTARCLLDARWSFGTPLHPDLAPLLEQADRRDEAGAAWLDGSDGWRGLWLEFHAAGPWPRRLRWLGQTLFPSPAYLRARHPGTPYWLLPWLYLRRAATGLHRRLQKGVVQKGVGGT